MRAPNIAKSVIVDHIHPTLWVLTLFLFFQDAAIAQDDQPCDCFETLEEPVLLSELNCEDKELSIRKTQNKLTQLTYRKMDYPVRARKNQISGEVVVEYRISTEGKASNFRIVNVPLGYGLEEEALKMTKAIGTLSFYPPQKDCSPINRTTRDTIVFRLQ